MSKGTHFFGQPVYGQLIKRLDKDKIIEMSRDHGGERYVKSFDGWHHLLTMLYAVILRFDSLREIEASMLAEVRKLGHLGLKTIPRRSTLSDANSRRSEKFFEDVYRDLYEANKATLSSDSRRGGTEAWMRRLRIIDSTTISLFSNLIFKGVGRHPKTIVLIYKRRWQIESLFKQIKQNFPLRYFYGESSNAIKIQIWVTLIANLLMTLLQQSLVRKCSISGLATMVRIVLMYYINLDSFLESPDEDLKRMLKGCAEPPSHTGEESQ